MLSRFLIAVALACGAASAHAAGMATHASMADFGRDALEDGPLKTILTQHRPALLAGAIYPDGGYGSGNAFPEDRDMAEAAHWGDFVVHFIEYLRATGCSGEVRNAILKRRPTGTINLELLSDRCGHLIAFAFGDAAHGLTDETWDGQFEPEVRARGEDPNITSFLAPLRTLIPAPAFDAIGQLYGATPMNALEYAGDMMNISERKLILNAPTLVFPPTQDLIEVYKRNGQTISAFQIERGNAFSRVAVQAESLAAPLDAIRIRNQMPWLAANYYTSAGGVVQSGYAVAGMYRQLWDLLTGDPAKPLPPLVVGGYPGPGAVDVRLETPRAGESWQARRWIHIFFSTSMDPDSYLLPSALCLFDEAGNRVAVTIEPGSWRRDYSHAVKLRLSSALQPGKRYTVVVTPKIKDYRGVPLARPYSYSFVTAAD